MDGDGAGDGYARSLAALATPPTNVLQWPAGWAIENVVSWIIEADPSVLTDAQLIAAGIPAIGFRNFLQT